MEFVPGGTLEARLGDGPLPLDEVTAIGAAIADALDDAHERGVLHRDLKPGNVGSPTSGRPKILDFGLALLLVGAKRRPAELTQAGMSSARSPTWRPNSWLGEADDARTDIYALGVTLFEMATGQRPFAQERPQALMFEIFNTAAPSVRSLRPMRPSDSTAWSRPVSRRTAQPPAPAAAVAAERCAARPSTRRAGRRRWQREDDPRDRRAPAAQSLAGSGAGVLRRRHDRSDDLRPRPDQGAAGDLADVGDALQGVDAVAAGDRTRAERRGDARGLRPARRRSRAVQRAAVRRPRPTRRSGPTATIGSSRTCSTCRANWRQKWRARSRCSSRPAKCGSSARRHVVNPEAHLEYLKSRHSALSGSREGVDLGAAACPARARARSRVRRRVVGDRRLPHPPRDPGHGAAGRSRGRGDRRRPEGARTGSDAGRRPRLTRHRPEPHRRSARRHPLVPACHRVESRAGDRPQRARRAPSVRSSGTTRRWRRRRRR